MIRRFQLMEQPERGFGPRLASAFSRLRDGVLRDNKVIPPVLAFLALIIFAWILAGYLISDPRDSPSERETANQANQPFFIQDDSETPAPSTENRDADSFSAYESKDPFRNLFPPEQEDTSGADGNGSTVAGDDGSDAGGGGGSTTGGDGSGGGGGVSGGGDGGGGGGDGGAGDGQYGGGDEDFIDQTSPGEDGGAGGSGGSGAGGSGTGGSGSGGSGAGGGGAGGDQYDGDLFDSGGNLAP